MTIAKAKIASIIDAMPDDVNIEEIMYRLYLLEKIEAGEKDVAEGKVISHAEVKERLSKKWQK